MNPFRIRKSQGEGLLFFPRVCRRPSSALSAPASRSLFLSLHSPRRFRRKMRDSESGRMASHRLK